MTNSEISLREAIKYIDKFCPVKIVFNGIVLQNYLEYILQKEWNALHKQSSLYMNVENICKVRGILNV